MKKYSFLLLAVLFLSLTACGNQSANKNINDSDNNHATDYNLTVYELADDLSAETKIAAVSENCVGFLLVEINPAFELYLTPDNNINELRVLGVNILNTDADLLFENLAVSGMTLYDALFSVLDAAREKGYLNEGGNIQFEAVGRIKPFEPEDLLRFMMIGYQEEKDISFSYNVTYTPVGETKITLIDEDLYDIVEKDENGNIIRTVKFNAEANTETTCIYDTNGNIVKTTELHTQNNTESTCVFDDNGELITEIIYNRNSEEVYEKHYEKGKLVKTYTHTPDMTRTEIFDENEKLSAELFEHHTEKYNYENYFSDGALIKSHYLYPEFERTQTFDSQGNMLSWIEDNLKENSYTEYYWTYHDNGNIARYIVKCTDSYYTQGMYHEEQYYPSGVMSMHYQVSQYGDNKYYYDENGNKTHFEGKNNFGEWVEIDY